MIVAPEHAGGQSGTVYALALLYLLLVLLLGLAFRRAQLPERITIVLFAGAATLSNIVEPHRLRTPQIVVPLLLIDFAVLIGLAFIALGYRRRWAMVATALQLISTLAHFGRVLDPKFDVTAYAVMESASSIPQVILLLNAIWRHPKRPQQS